MKKQEQLFLLKTVDNTALTRLAYSIKAFITQTILVAVSSIFPFIIRYLIIQYWGAEYLGLNSLFSSIIHTLNLAELGFDSAIVYSMYKPFAEHDIKQVNNLLAFYRKTYITIALVICILGICCIPLLRFLIKGSYPAEIVLSKVFIIFLSNIVLNYSLFSYKNAILKAAQRTDIDNKILIVCSFLMYSTQICIMIYLQNYYLYALMLPVSTVLGNIIRKIIVDKKFPYIRCNGKLEEEYVGILKKHITAIFLSRIRNLSRYAMDSVFISSFLGLTWVALYQNYYSVLLLPLLFLEAVLKSVKNSLGNFFAVENREDSYLFLFDFTFLCNWIISWAGICLMCLYSHFIRLWLGENYVFPISTTFLFSMLFYTFGLGNMVTMLMDVTGLWRYTKYCSIVEACFNLFLNYVLLQFLGINGILIATILSILLINIPWEMSTILRKFFFVPANKYFLKLLYYFLVTNFIGFIVYYINSIIQWDGILSFMLRCFICFIVPNILFVMAYIRTKEIRNMYHLIKRITKLGI